MNKRFNKTEKGEGALTFSWRSLCSMEMISRFSPSRIRSNRIILFVEADFGGELEKRRRKKKEKEIQNRTCLSNLINQG